MSVLFYSRVSSLDLHQDQQMNYMESINILAISNSTPQDLAISEVFLHVPFL